MSKTNCVNCGAAKDTSEIKCPFCGTTYLDLTAIDFTSDDPVVCEFVLPFCKQRTVLRMLAIPQFNSCNIQHNTVSVYGGMGVPLATVNTGTDIDFNISFTPVVQPNHKELITLKVEK
jgi:hypothetical protein